MEENISKKGVPVAAVVGITILVAIIFGAGAYMYANNQTTQEKDTLNAQIVALQNEVTSAKKAATTTSDSSTSVTNTDNETSSTEKSSIPSDWKTYKNQKLGYQLQYPSDWTASDEGKTDPAYPYDIEISKRSADPEKGDDYYIGIGSSLYGTNVAGVIFTRESMLKDITANSAYKKISTAGSEGYYITEETKDGGTHWMIAILGDKGVANMDFDIEDSSKEALYRQVVKTFKFN